MSGEYPGFATVARGYWQSYISAVTGMGFIMLFTGALGAVITLAVLPEAIWYLLVATVSLLLHSAAMFVKDIRTGEYEPDQVSSLSLVTIVAVAVGLGVQQAGVLTIAAVVGYASFNVAGLPLAAAVIVAAYYPVADLTLSRWGIPTPGVIILQAVMSVLGTVFNVRSSPADVVPIAGRRQRPQS